MKGKVYVIFAKTPETKQKWMEAFLRERERVREDKEKGLTNSHSHLVQRNCIQFTSGMICDTTRALFTRIALIRIGIRFSAVHV